MTKHVGTMDESFMRPTIFQAGCLCGWSGARTTDKDDAEAGFARHELAMAVCQKYAIVGKELERVTIIDEPGAKSVAVNADAVVLELLCANALTPGKTRLIYIRPHGDVDEIEYSASGFKSFKPLNRDAAPKKD